MCLLKYIFNCEQHFPFFIFRSELSDIRINCDRIIEGYLYVEFQCIQVVIFFFTLELQMYRRKLVTPSGGRVKGSLNVYKDHSQCIYLHITENVNIRRQPVKLGERLRIKNGLA
jgi:hypothetical protein